MGLSPDQVGAMSLGQWYAVLTGWNAAHNGDKPSAPTDEEFFAAIEASDRIFNGRS